jgi:hypothetical protein
VKIRISSAARSAIRGAIAPGREFVETAVQVGPDAWDVDLERSTVDGLERVKQQRGFTDYSDAILWLVSNQRGAN